LARRTVRADLDGSHAAGEEALARWLLAPATLAELRDRHAAVEELRHRLDLREDLALLGDEARASLDSEPLRSGANSPRCWTRLHCACWPDALAWWQCGAGELDGLFHSRQDAGGRAGAGSAFGLLICASAFWRRLGAVNSRHDLALMAQVLVRLERERFSSPRLVELRRVWKPRGIRLWHIARLNRLVDCWIRAIISWCA